MLRTQIIKKNNGGFSIPELLVVIGIMAIFITFVFIRENDFKSTVQLRNVAYELALSVRETQAYGIGILRDNPEGRFGIHIDLDNPTYTILYTDNNIENGVYDTGELVKEVYLQDEFTIEKLCIVLDATGVEVCSDTSSQVSPLNILFVRPNPNAVMLSDLGDVSSAKIYVGTLGADPVVVQVSGSGQVSIE